jgi:hypothetical protein
MGERSGSAGEGESWIDEIIKMKSNKKSNDIM